MSSRRIFILVLLAGSALAVPRWWTHMAGSEPQGSAADPIELAVRAVDGYVPPPGGVVVDGILYLTTTIYLAPGEAMPTPAQNAQTVSSSAPSQALAASAQPALQQASNIASTTPSGPNTILTPELLLKIAPDSATCGSTPGCATASTAAPALALSFKTYNISAPAAQAAVTALVAYESASFRYNINVSPGVPGQGTYNMMSPKYVAAYAAEVLSPDLVAQAGADPAKLLGLVNQDVQRAFASGAWFIRRYCSDALGMFARQGGADQAWKAYLACVDTPDNPEREAYWGRAKTAFGV